MSCAAWEREITLYAGGDLSAKKAAAVAWHLEGCAECRDLAAGLYDWRAAVQELGEESVDAAVLESVRARVMARVAQRPGRRTIAWRIRTPLAYAAAAVVVALLLWPQWMPRDVAPPLAPVAAIPAAPPAPRIVWAKDAPRVRRRAPVLVATSEPLLMKIATADPSVVIYWIVEGRQKGE
jgi:anti-sigma factor RsiW